MTVSFFLFQLFLLLPWRSARPARALKSLRDGLFERAAFDLKSRERLPENLKTPPARAGKDERPRKAELRNPRL
ncbi:hypothetical protein A9R05_12225 [Burkholderia sp. KK1]|nr:hypothetical protein A9R05_12225 [Burkholderia sp. KK1]